MNNLETRRKSAGLTRGQLAKLSGISISSLRRYEIEERNPTAPQILRLSHVLKCTPNDLLGVNEKEGEIE